MTDERTLEKQFDRYGDIRRVNIIYDKNTNKSKGYAFIEYKDPRVVDSAVRRGDGRRLDGRNILVDKELARIDRYWLPRRLGGGKGGEYRRNREEENYIREIKRELREQWKKDADIQKEKELKQEKIEPEAKRPKTEDEKPSTVLMPPPVKTEPVAIVKPEKAVNPEGVDAEMEEGEL